jgi:hypothetical protein
VIFFGEGMLHGAGFAFVIRAEPWVNRKEIKIISDAR